MNITRRSLFLALLSAALAVAEVNPAGNWDCAATNPNGNDMPFTMEVAKTADSLTVKLRSDRGEIEGLTPKLEGDTLKFDILMGEGRVTLSLKIDGDSFQGTWALGSESGPVKGKRKAS